MTTLDGRRLASIAYHALAEQLSKAQQELVMLDAVQDTFGERAVATSSIVRTGQNCIAKSEDQIAFQRKLLLERIDEIIQTLEEMEPYFASAREEDDKAFADFILSRRVAV
jgi:hypothetical protein